MSGKSEMTNAERIRAFGKAGCPLARELVVMRGFCANRGDDDRVDAAWEKYLGLIDSMNAARIEATGALSLLARIREAVGDDGKRMQDELIEYLRQMRADAERYRWLRDVTCGLPDDMPVVAARTPDDVVCLVGQELDDAIDRARDEKTCEAAGCLSCPDCDPESFGAASGTKGA